MTDISTKSPVAFNPQTDRVVAIRGDAMQATIERVTGIATEAYVDAAVAGGSGGGAFLALAQDDPAEAAVTFSFAGFDAQGEPIRIEGVLDRANHEGLMPLDSLAQGGATVGQALVWLNGEWTPGDVEGIGGVSEDAGNVLILGSDGRPFLHEDAITGDGGGAVTSVNGFTGAVSLTFTDVGAAPTAHTHAIGDTTGLQTALDGKAPTEHAHAIGDVTGLQAELDSKHASGEDARDALETLEGEDRLHASAIRGLPSGEGSGDVVGPESSVDGRAALFDGTSGKLLKQAAAAPVLEGDTRIIFQPFPEDGDFNDMTDRGVFVIDGTSGTVTNGPASGSFGILRVTPRAVDRVDQEHVQIGANGAGRRSTRTFNADGWSNWDQIVRGSDGVLIADALLERLTDDEGGALVAADLEATFAVSREAVDADPALPLVFSRLSSDMEDKPEYKHPAALTEMALAVSDLGNVSGVGGSATPIDPAFAIRLLVTMTDDYELPLFTEPFDEVDYVLRVDNTGGYAFNVHSDWEVEKGITDYPEGIFYVVIHFAGGGTTGRITNVLEF